MPSRRRSLVIQDAYGFHPASLGGFSLSMRLALGRHSIGPLNCCGPAQTSFGGIRGPWTPGGASGTTAPVQPRPYAADWPPRARDFPPSDLGIHPISSRDLKASLCIDQEGLGQWARPAGHGEGRHADSHPDGASRGTETTAFRMRPVGGTAGLPLLAGNQQ